MKTTRAAGPEPTTKNEGGFSLLELMIALVILAVGLLGYISLHVNSIQGNSDAASRTNAAFASQALIDYFQMAGYDNITSSTSYTEVTASNYSAVYDLIPSGYAVTYKTTDVDMNDDGTNDAKKVEVQVTDSHGNIKSKVSVICPKDV